MTTISFNAPTLDEVLTMSRLHEVYEMYNDVQECFSDEDKETVESLLNRIEKDVIKTRATIMNRISNIMNRESNISHN